MRKAICRPQPRVVHCPVAATLIVAYRPATGTEPVPSRLSEFTCPPCGVEFTWKDDLLFQSISEQWLLAGIHFSNRVPGQINFNQIYEGENYDEIGDGTASIVKETL